MCFIFDVVCGECIVVFGFSGVGKSILLNLIVGFLLFVSGSLLINGEVYNVMLLV